MRATTRSRVARAASPSVAGDTANAVPSDATAASSRIDSLKRFMRFAPECSQVEDAQRQRLADSLGAVLHVELAQDLLHVIFHRQRADREDGADFDVALADVDPA